MITTAKEGETHSYVNAAAFGSPVVPVRVVQQRSTNVVGETNQM